MTYVLDHSQTHIYVGVIDIGEIAMPGVELDGLLERKLSAVMEVGPGHLDVTQMRYLEGPVCIGAPFGIGLGGKRGKQQQCHR